MVVIFLWVQKFLVLSNDDVIIMNCFRWQKEIQKNARLPLDFAQLREDIPVGDFASVLQEEPATVLSCLAIAAHHALLELNVRFSIPKLTVRLMNYTPLTAMRNLKSHFVDKFIALRGNVVRVSAIKPLVTSMYFECTKCGSRCLRYFPDGKFNPPASCEVKILVTDCCTID